MLKGLDLSRQAFINTMFSKAWNRIRIKGSMHPQKFPTSTVDCRRQFSERYLARVRNPTIRRPQIKASSIPPHLASSWQLIAEVAAFHDDDPFFRVLFQSARGPKAPLKQPIYLGSTRTFSAARPPFLVFILAKNILTRTLHEGPCHGVFPSPVHRAFVLAIATVNYPKGRGGYRRLPPSDKS